MFNHGPEMDVDDGVLDGLDAPTGLSCLTQRELAPTPGFLECRPGRLCGDDAPGQGSGPAA